MPVSCSAGWSHPAMAPRHPPRARLGELSEPDREVADRFVGARLLVADRDLATREPVSRSPTRRCSQLAAAARVAGERPAVDRPTAAPWRRRHANGTSRADLTESCTGAPASKPCSKRSRSAAQQLNEDERDFVDASRIARDAEHQRERARSRRLRRLLVATSCVLVLALIAGAIAVSQSRHARGVETDSGDRSACGQVAVPSSNSA